MQPERTLRRLGPLKVPLNRQDKSPQDIQLHSVRQDGRFFHYQH
jgi:hypothetical protein